MEELKEKRLKLQRKKLRRHVRFFFFVGLLLGSASIFAFYHFYWLPELAAATKLQADRQNNTIDSLTTQLTTTNTKLEDIERLAKEEEERKKPRVVFGTDDEGKDNPALVEPINSLLTEAGYIGSVLVIQNDQVVLEKGYGYANKQKEQPNTARSEFLIASVQKSMTAVLIMTLVEENLVSLDTPLSTFYPSVPNSQSITIKDLLDMTSGLSVKGYNKNGLSEEDSINYTLANVTYQPLTKWKNAPANYTLLAGIIRQLTGQSYESYFTETIITELRLKHTGFSNTYLGRSDRAISSSKKARPYETETQLDTSQLSAETGTGNVYSSTGDMFTFLQALIDGKLISQASLNALWQPQQKPFTYRYAGGYYQQQQAIEGHGVLLGYESTIRLSKDGKTGVITLSNYILPDEKNAQVTADIFKLLTI